MPIHPTAILDTGSSLPADLDVGPYAVVDGGVTLGDGIRIGAFCRLHAGTVLGDRVRLSEGVVVGGAPQDMKYRGERTGVSIGEGTELREYVTVNRGTSASGLTRIGRDCLVMAYAHVAHDCVLEDKAVIANSVQMGGHVRIGRGAVISGLTGIHQFVTLGAGCFVGGGLRVDKDVLPFSKAMGEPLRYAGLNPMGMRKSALAEGAESLLKGAYRALATGGEEACRQWLSDHAPERGLPVALSVGADGKGEAGDSLAGLVRLLHDYLATHHRGILSREMPGRAGASGNRDRMGEGSAEGT